MICLSPNGQLLYVSNENRYNYQIDVLNVSDGSRVRTFRFDTRYHLGCVSSSNELFMANTSGIVVFDTTNGSIRTIRNQALGRPQGLCLFGDSLYVADLLNECIHVFNVDGTYIQGIGKGQINKPKDVCVSPDGELLFVSAMRDIHVYRTDGTYIRSIVPFHGGSNSAMTLSPNGEFLFVYSATKAKIKMLRAEDGTLVREIGINLSDRVGNMCVSADGKELFVEFLDYYTHEHNIIKVFQL
jgi:sugar lactone lactonase YvrE